MASAGAVCCKLPWPLCCSPHSSHRLLVRLNWLSSSSVGVRHPCRLRTCWPASSDHWRALHGIRFSMGRASPLATRGDRLGHCHCLCGDVRRDGLGLHCVYTSSIAMSRSRRDKHLTYITPAPNPSIERTSSSQLRCLAAAAHVER